MRDSKTNSSRAFKPRPRVWKEEKRKKKLKKKKKNTYNYIPYLQNRCGHPWETKSEGRRGSGRSAAQSPGTLWHKLCHRGEVFWAPGSPPPNYRLRPLAPLAERQEEGSDGGAPTQIGGRREHIPPPQAHERRIIFRQRRTNGVTHQSTRGHYFSFAGIIFSTGISPVESGWERLSPSFGGELSAGRVCAKSARCGSHSCSKMHPCQQEVKPGAKQQKSM